MTSLAPTNIPLRSLAWGDLTSMEAFFTATLVHTLFPAKVSTIELRSWKTLLRQAFIVDYRTAQEGVRDPLARMDCVSGTLFAASPLLQEVRLPQGLLLKLRLYLLKLALPTMVIARRCQVPVRSTDQPVNFSN